MNEQKAISWLELALGGTTFKDKDKYINEALALLEEQCPTCKGAGAIATPPDQTGVYYIRCPNPNCKEKK